MVSGRAIGCGREGKHICEYTRTDRNALDFSMWVGNSEVVEEEHAVEGFGEELDLRLSHQSIGTFLKIERYSPRCSQLSKWRVQHSPMHMSAAIQVSVLMVGTRDSCPYLPEARCRSQKARGVEEVIGHTPVRRVRIGSHVKESTKRRAHGSVLKFVGSRVSRRCGTNSAMECCRGELALTSRHKQRHNICPGAKSQKTVTWLTMKQYKRFRIVRAQNISNMPALPSRNPLEARTPALHLPSLGSGRPLQYLLPRKRKSSFNLL